MARTTSTLTISLPPAMLEELERVRKQEHRTRSELINRVGPQVVIDTPLANAAVTQPFVVAGWAIDPDSTFDTGISTLHGWAYPVTDPTNPIFLGVTAYGGARPDVAAIFGDRFRDSGYGLVVESLPPGTYDVAMFGWSTTTGAFLPAKVVRVTVR